MQVAIDGPASSGKSTISKFIAKETGFLYLDTGAMYRATTLAFLRNNISVDDASAIDELLENLVISFKNTEDGQLVFLNGEDVTREIRDLEVTRNVSEVSAIKSVRAKLVQMQREIAENHSIIMDGRDIGTVVLPNGTGKTVRVLVIAKGDKAKEAMDAGADFVGAEEMITKIQNENWFEYDVIVTTPDMMGVIGRIGKVLGPKGLMPNPKSGTITMDVKKAVQDIKAGKVEYRLDKTNITHLAIGKVSFGPEKLKENYTAIMDALVKAKPAAAKGQYIKGIALTTTMGPGIKVAN